MFPFSNIIHTQELPSYRQHGDHCAKTLLLLSLFPVTAVSRVNVSVETGLNWVENLNISVTFNHCFSSISINILQSVLSTCFTLRYSVDIEITVKTTVHVNYLIHDRRNRKNSLVLSFFLFL